MFSQKSGAVGSSSCWTVTDVEDVMRSLARVRTSYDVPNFDVDSSNEDPAPDGGSDFDFKLDEDLKWKKNCLMNTTETYTMEKFA
ncbi:unnamed protein product [Vicia faba]|uniref:Uncharacterized protein n=1 Tax=Vicia faba TaxID=3906 RepID=A0AAV0YUU0_VICFA|nr:unnamed protein product [Vicia faba]